MPDSLRYDWLGDVPLQWDTFLDTPPEEAAPSSARVFVIPVPYDSTTSFKGGAREGPRAIINASRHLEDYDLELDRDISLVGIHTTPALRPNVGSPEAMIEQVHHAVSLAARSDKFVVVLGGEHTVSVGAVRAMAELYSDPSSPLGTSLSVLYLDAHADLRDCYMGTRWGHASVARRIYDICPLVQVGVRSLSANEMDFIREVKLPVFFWESRTPELSGLVDSIIEKLSGHVYVSVDMDVFDPSIMAAVGTPEPGGMTWDDVAGLLKAVSKEREIVGFDITELSPGEGPEACAFTAAKLAYKLMGYATL